MAKRFTDTDKYKKPFVRGLQGPYKLLWDYITHDCDHAGIWIVDFEIAQIYLGKDMPVCKEDALVYFNEGKQRIIELENGSAWLIVPFIEEQYGILNPANKVHSSVIDILKLHNIDLENIEKNKPLTSPLQGAKEKDKDIYKDKVKDKEKEKDEKSEFENFRSIYPGTKRGYETELRELKKHPDWKDITPVLLPILQKQINQRDHQVKQGQFVPPWPHLKTWLNQRRWESESSELQSSDKEVFYNYAQMEDMITSGKSKQTDFEFIEVNGQKRWKKRQQ